jgi:hypothetical protein
MSSAAVIGGRRFRKIKVQPRTKPETTGNQKFFAGFFQKKPCLLAFPNAGAMRRVLGGVR